MKLKINQNLLTFILGSALISRTTNDRDISSEIPLINLISNMLSTEEAARSVLPQDQDQEPFLLQNPEQVLLLLLATVSRLLF